MLQSQLRNSGGLRSKIYCLLLLTFFISLTGCFDDTEEDFLFTDFLVEFDAAADAGGNSVGRTYPLLNEVDRGSGLHSYQINLIGGQKETSQTLEYRVVSEETTAIEGVHYNLPQSGTYIIEANSSFGSIEVEVLDFEIGSGQAILVLELVGNEEIKVAENYKRIGIPIDRRGNVEPGVLIPTIPLHEQLGGEFIFTHIAIDPLHPDLSQDFQDRWNTARNNVVTNFGGRSPHNLSFFFRNDNTVEVAMGYFFGGGKAPATLLYEFEVDENGVGEFIYISGDTNGDNLRPRMDAIFANYLEKYKFQVKWVDDDITSPPEDRLVGGLFKVDDPSSYLFGSVNNVANKNIWFLPSSPVIPFLFQRNDGELYTTILIDPNDPKQSEEFRNRWDAAVQQGIAEAGGRNLHGLMLVFDPDFNAFQLVFYYTFNEGAGQSYATFRNQLFLDHEGNIERYQYSENANARVVWAPVLNPLLVDYYFNEFRVEESSLGEEIISLYRQGETEPFAFGSLGNNPLDVDIFFPE